MRLVCFSSPSLYNFSLVTYVLSSRSSLLVFYQCKYITVFYCLLATRLTWPVMSLGYSQRFVCLFILQLMLDGNVHFVTLQHERRVKVEIAAGGHLLDYKLVRVSGLNILQAQLFPACSLTFNHFDSSCSLSQSLCGCFEFVLCQFFLLIMRKKNC